MTVAVRGRVPRWDKTPEADRAAQHIQERLQALERALAGGAPQFTNPTVPTFGSGPIVAPGGGGGGGGTGGGSTTTPGVTDHGLLTGLADDDHPQYAQQWQDLYPSPHTHDSFDVNGLEGRFIQRGEGVEVHQHSMADVTDLRANDAQFILAVELFGSP